MPELFAIFFLIFAVYLAVKVLYVVLRVGFKIVGGVLRAVGTLLVLPFHVLGYILSAGGANAEPASPRRGGPVLGVPCGNPTCACPNIAGARFCRRCGTDLRRVTFDARMIRPSDYEWRSTWS